MSVSRKSIVTDYGRLYGRDCIFLDEQSEDKALKTFTLAGDINGTSCEISAQEKWVPYTLRFDGVITWQSQDIEGSNWDWDSCFDELTGSQLLTKYNSNCSTAIKHFTVQTYDVLFDIICTDYALALGKPFAA